MRAAFLTGREQLEVGPTHLDAPDGAAVEVAVEACGICGSNLHGWRHPELAINKEAIPEPGAGGHEIAASVMRTGGSVTDLHPGALVVVEPNLTGACRSCEACAGGRHWFCSARGTIPSWGFADRMVVPAASLFLVPEGLSPEVATLAEPLACGVHAVRSSGLAARSGGRIDGARVAVLGAGVAGLLAAAASRALGAATVAVTARYPHQADAALSGGADEVIDARADDVRDRVRAHAPQLVVEAVGGTAPTLELAMQAVAPMGEVAVLGLFGERQQIDARRAVFRELRMSFPVTYGVQEGVHDFSIALEILAGDPGLFAGLITDRLPLDRIGEAFTRAANKATGSLRVVVTP